MNPGGLARRADLEMLENTYLHAAGARLLDDDQVSNRAWNGEVPGEGRSHGEKQPAPGRLSERRDRRIEEEDGGHGVVNRRERLGSTLLRAAIVSRASSIFLATSLVVSAATAQSTSPNTSTSPTPIIFPTMRVSFPAYRELQLVVLQAASPSLREEAGERRTLSSRSQQA